MKRPRKPAKKVAKKFAKKFERVTARLHVRPWRAADFEEWKRAYQARLPKRNRFDNGPVAPRTMTRARFARMLEKQREVVDRDRNYTFAAFDRASGQQVGSANVFVLVRWMIQNAILGYSVHNNHWGKGYGREMIAAVIDIAFRDLKLHRLQAEIDPGNPRSIGLARSAGMRHEGTARRYIFDRDGKWKDLRVFAITAEEIGLRGVKPSVRRDKD